MLVSFGPLQREEGAVLARLAEMSSMRREESQLLVR